MKFVLTLLAVGVGVWMITILWAVLLEVAGFLIAGAVALVVLYFCASLVMNLFSGEPGK